jgi:hypothetical protein
MLFGQGLSGSLSFAKPAETSNPENLLVTRDTTIARQYADNWQDHAKQPAVYAGWQRGCSATGGKRRKPKAA